MCCDYENAIPLGTKLIYLATRGGATSRCEVDRPLIAKLISFACRGRWSPRREVNRPLEQRGIDLTTRGVVIY